MNEAGWMAVIGLGCGTISSIVTYCITKRTRREETHEQRQEYLHRRDVENLGLHGNVELLEKASGLHARMKEHGQEFIDLQKLLTAAEDIGGKQRDEFRQILADTLRSLAESRLEACILLDSHMEIQVALNRDIPPYFMIFQDYRALEFLTIVTHLERGKFGIPDQIQEGGTLRAFYTDIQTAYRNGRLGGQAVESAERTDDIPTDQVRAMIDSYRHLIDGKEKGQYPQ